MIEDINSVVTRVSFLVKGKEFKFVRFEEPDKIVAWFRNYVSGENFEHLGFLKARSVGVDVLKNIDVWDKLSKELQESLILEESEFSNLPGNLKLALRARRNKGPKYPGLEYQIKCISCGKVVKTSPGVTVKNAEAIAKRDNIIFTPKDYVSSFICGSCKKESRHEKKNKAKCDDKAEVG